MLSILSKSRPYSIGLLLRQLNARSVFTDKTAVVNKFNKQFIDNPVYVKSNYTAYDKECLIPEKGLEPARSKIRVEHSICGPSVLDTNLMGKTNRRKAKRQGDPTQWQVTVRYLKKNPASTSVTDCDQIKGKKLSERNYGTSRPIPIIKLPLPTPPAQPKRTPLNNKIVPLEEINNIMNTRTYTGVCGGCTKKLAQKEVGNIDHCIPQPKVELYEPVVKPKPLVKQKRIRVCAVQENKTKKRVRDCTPSVRYVKQDKCRPTCRKPCQEPPEIRIFPKD